MRISVCFPQYNRWRHLLANLEALRVQTYPRFEVIVSDDSSTDETRAVIPDWLAASGLNHKFLRQKVNVGYDANLRAALQAAEGDYLLVLGNDDRLPAPDTLERLADALERHGYPAIAIGNTFQAGTSARACSRIPRTELLGSGPDLALRTFRLFAVVMGVVYSRQAFRTHNTANYDGSVYVQVYLASRIIASGGKLLTVAEPLAECGLDVAGAGHARSYLDSLKEAPWRLRKHAGGLDELGRVAIEAIEPYVPPAARQTLVVSVYRQLLLTSYPHWLHVYRRQVGWRFALNLAAGCSPGHLTRRARPSRGSLARLAACHAAVTVPGLLAPLHVLRSAEWAVTRLRDSVR